MWIQLRSHLCTVSDCVRCGDAHPAAAAAAELSLPRGSGLDGEKTEAASNEKMKLNESHKIGCDIELNNARDLV